MAKQSVNKSISPSRPAESSNTPGSGLSVAQRLAKSRKDTEEKAVFAAKLTDQPKRRR